MAEYESEMRIKMSTRPRPRPPLTTGQLAIARFDALTAFRWASDLDTHKLCFQNTYENYLIELTEEFIELHVLSMSSIGIHIPSTSKSSQSIDMKCNKFFGIRRTEILLK